MFTEAQNFAIVQTELDSVFYQKFQYDATNPGIATANSARLFKPLQTEHAAYIEEVFKGSPLFSVVGETQSVPQSTPKVANKYTVYIKDFAQGIEISKDLFDDNMHGVWAKTVADLALKARVTQDQNAFSVFNNGFTTALTADGSAIFSTHTLIGGGTQANNATTALSVDSLNTGIVSLRTQKDQAGVVLGSVPSILLVPPALFKKAIEVTESALIADSGNNNVNVYRSAYGIEVMTSPYLSAAAGGSDTAWFLLADNHAFTRYIRQGVQTALRDWIYSNNRTYFYQANFREEVACIDYVGSYGSTGTT